MFFAVLKAALSGVLVLIVPRLPSETRRSAGLIASLPLVSCSQSYGYDVTPETANAFAAHAQFTFWLVLPSLPMFLLAVMLRHWRAVLDSAGPCRSWVFQNFRLYAKRTPAAFETHPEVRESHERAPGSKSLIGPLAAFHA
jgi:hypothetical protein